MSPRTGRPRSENPKNCRVELRLTEEEQNKLDYCCEKTGKSRSEVARDGIDIIYANLRNVKGK